MTAKSEAEHLDDGDNDDVENAELDDTDADDVKQSLQSNPKFDRKFIIARKGTLISSKFYKLRHPKHDTGAIYRISEDFFDELIMINDQDSSIFYGDSVISNGAIKMCLPLNPLFVALPYFAKKRERFEELDEILADDEYPAISLLQENAQFRRMISTICDVKNLGGDIVVYRYNEELALSWLKGKFEALREALVQNAQLKSSVSSNPEALDRYTYSHLEGHLSPEMAAAVKSTLGIVDAPATEELCEFPKRKAVDDEDFENQAPPAKKSVKESSKTRALKAASKGTKSIASFFTKK